MNIKESKCFEVIKTEKLAGSLRVVLQHSQTSNIIEVVGTVLEAEYMYGDLHLIFITEGNLFEEALYIYLIDPNLIIKDTIEISAAYTPGIFRNPIIQPPNKINFSFFEPEDYWLIEVVDEPRFFLWGSQYPVKRKCFFYKSWLKIEKI